jgi:hypothetical protein
LPNNAFLDQYQPAILSMWVTAPCCDSTFETNKQRMTTSSLENLCVQLTRIEQNCRRRDTSKLDHALLTDLHWSASADVPATAPMPHTVRSVAWLADRRRVKAQQIAMARAADQQQQLDLLARASAASTRAFLRTFIQTLFYFILFYFIFFCFSR